MDAGESKQRKYHTPLVEPFCFSFFSRTASKTDGGSKSLSYCRALCTLRNAAVAVAALAVLGLKRSE